MVRKKIDSVNKELKPLGHTVQKKVRLKHNQIHWPVFKICFVEDSDAKLVYLRNLQEREYKEALEAFNEKNREKVQLITRLMEVSQQMLKSLFVEFEWLS